MNNLIYAAIGAVTGCIAGAATAWFIAKHKYATYLKPEELNEIREYYRHLNDDKNDTESKKNPEEKIQETNPVPAENHAKEYEEVLSQTKYAGEDPVVIRNNPEDRPYVISPEQFQDSDYEAITLTYYADGILADDEYDIVDDIEGTVGDALEHFGDYEDDLVYVRNDSREVDYEVTIDNGPYAPRAGY